MGRNLFYVYNANDIDVSCESPGYGAQPPAFGIQVLKGPLLDPDGIDNTDEPIIPAFNGSGFGDGIVDNERYGLAGSMFWKTTGIPGSVQPSMPAHYHNYLRGNWADGTSLTHGGIGYGGATPTAFAFPGDTDPDGVGTSGAPQAPWTDSSSSDQKGVAILGPLTLGPGAEQEVLLAVVFGRATTGGIQESIVALQQASDAVRAFAENTPGLLLPGQPCTSFVTSIQDRPIKSPTPILHPNPASEQLHIRTTDHQGPMELHILDARGAMVKQERTAYPLAPINIGGLAPGIYTLRLVDDAGIRTGRFVKQ